MFLRRKRDEATQALQSSEEFEWGILPEGPLPPMIFISVASKGFSDFVSHLEPKLARDVVCVAFKGVRNGDGGLAIHHWMACGKEHSFDREKKKGDSKVAQVATA